MGDLYWESGLREILLSIASPARAVERRWILEQNDRRLPTPEELESLAKDAIDELGEEPFSFGFVARGIHSDEWRASCVWEALKGKELGRALRSFMMMPCRTLRSAARASCAGADGGR